MAVWNEVQISTMIEKDRIDAEFFQKQYIVLDKYIGDGLPLSEIASTVDLQSNGAFRQIFDILNDNGHKEVPYIRSGNVGDFFLNRNELHFISNKAHSLLPKTHTKHGDILMARKGKIGGATLITEDDVDLNSNDNVVNIRIKDSRYIPGYVVAFLNSKFGLSQVQRLSTGNVQPWLSMKQVRMLRTVLLDYADQQKISGIVSMAYSKNKLSKSLYAQVQELLEKELELDQLVQEKPKSYEANFSEVVINGRVDAQCYKPEYIEYEKHLRKRGNFDYLGNVLVSSIKGQQAEIVIDGDMEYVSIKDIQGLEIYSGEKCSQSSKIRIAEKGDLLLAITGATIGKIGIVSRSNKLAFSGDLLSLKTNKSIDPYYLLAVMSNPIGQSQCQRWITGSTNGHLSPVDVNKIVIPRISVDLENKISELVQSAITVSLESEQLLKQAKKRVEDLIEGGIK